MFFTLRLSVAILAAVCAGVLPAAAAAKKIVLIGGPKSHGVGQHDFYHGVAALKTLLEASDDFKRQKNIAIVESPFEWPAAHALDGAATLVLYLDGNDMHPLLDAKRRAQFDKLMAQGVGLVALHQAFTVPVNDTSVDLPKWLGGARYGLYDRVDGMVELKPSTPDHPVSRGIGELTYLDEFYPTIRFSQGMGQFTPILSGEMTPQSGEAVKTKQAPRNAVAAWAFERNGGGRSVGFSGLHFVAGLDEPAIRTMVLNSIFWTAGLEVPKNGVSTRADEKTATKLAFPGLGRPPIKQAIVARRSDNQIIKNDWGQLEWYVSGPLGNSDTMTTGVARVAVGKANPRHFHPNCDEVLHVLKGRIRHTMNDMTVEMSEGDTVSIPQGVMHNATNIGNEEAVLAISFSSPWREVVGE